MKITKILFLLIISASALTGCKTEQTSDSTGPGNSPGDGDETVYQQGEGVWAKENFDLLAVSNLVEKAATAEEFEKLINRESDLNNLDLNGDGFADYISVQEFNDRTDDQRGFTLFSKFGPNDIQEIASLIFSRDRPDQRGAAFFIRGNEQIYGDNFGYQANWLDKSLRIADWAFGNRDDYYRSPYYYDNYPDYYDQQRIVETARYRERITKYQVNPAMTKITTETSKIKIKSPYPGRSYNRAFAKMARPTREQIEFYKSNPRKPDPAKVKDKQDPPGSSGDQSGIDKDKAGKSVEKSERNAEKPDREKKPVKTETKAKGKEKPPQNEQKKGGGKPEKNSPTKGGGNGKGKSGKN